MNFKKNRYKIFLFIFSIFALGIAKEHALKIDLGSTLKTSVDWSPDRYFMGSLQYQYSLSNNVTLGLKHIQRHGNYVFATSTGPVIGYTLHLNEQFFTEFESGLGLHINGGAQLIPDLTPFISVSPALYFSISKRISIGIRYGMESEFLYDRFIHDFAITSKISIFKK